MPGNLATPTGEFKPRQNGGALHMALNSGSRNFTLLTFTMLYHLYR